MKALLALAALLVLTTAHSAAAQQPAGTGTGVRQEVESVLQRSGVAAAVDSVAASATPELELALGQLALAVNDLMSRIANDPQLRRAALEAAQGMVGVAQVVVEEHSQVIQDVLRAAAEEIESLPAPEPSADRARAPKP